MHYVIAMDSFKGSLSSSEAGSAAKDGILAADKTASVTVLPIADGGEGTMEALIYDGGKLHTVEATFPDGTRHPSAFGITRDGTAVIETAAAAGLPVTPLDKRDPMHTTTFGVGEQIASALNQGCRRFIIGLGGCATNDGGAGMLQALGAKMTDENGADIPFGCAGLGKLRHIDLAGLHPALQESTFMIACDVTNPLCGSLGCSAVFSPQKGAKPADIPVMDGYLAAYANLVKAVIPDADPDYPGSGAAGGLGFAFRTFLRGTLTSGIDLVMTQTHMEDSIRDADIVITGEGRLDAQTVMGKAPSGVAKCAKKYGIPVIALAGSVTKDAVKCNEHGIDAYFPVLRRVMTLEEAMEKETAKENIARTAEQAARLIGTMRR